MKRLDFELHPVAWANKVLVDGELLQYVTGLKIDIDPRGAHTRVTIEYFPEMPKSPEAQPITLSGYLLDEENHSERNAAGLAMMEQFEKMPEIPLFLKDYSTDQDAWLVELREWAMNARRTARKMLMEP